MVDAIMTDKEIESRAENLLGTCESTPREFDEFGTEEWGIIDNITMLCNGCGWWVPPEEMGEEDCHECEE